MRCVDMPQCAELDAEQVFRQVVSVFSPKEPIESQVRYEEKPTKVDSVESGCWV